MLLAALVGMLPVLGNAQQRVDDAAAERESSETSTTETPDRAARSQEAEEQEDAEEEQLICRRIQVTGTHRRVRRCFTQAQIESQREEAQEFLRRRVRVPNVPSAEGQ
jgi:hypothetical protein